MDMEYIKTAFRERPLERIREDTAVRAAVLIPLVERRGALHILFEERNAHIPQGGEICFPGGHAEEGEALADAAVRETAEEQLLDPAQIELVAPLHRLDANGLREIYSFLGVIRGYADTWAADEVARTFLIPLDWFLSHAPEVYEGRTTVAPGADFPYDLIPGGEGYHFASARQKFYFYRTEQGVIWGLTAKLLFHFLERWKQI